MENAKETKRRSNTSMRGAPCQDIVLQSANFGIPLPMKRHDSWVQLSNDLMMLTRVK